MQFEITGVARLRLLWETTSMQKPHLISVERIHKIPTIGGCSACPEVRFQVGELIGRAEENEGKMRELFDAHFREVHLCEYTRQ